MTLPKGSLPGNGALSDDLSQAFPDWITFSHSGILHLFLILFYAFPLLWKSGACMADKPTEMLSTSEPLSVSYEQHNFAMVCRLMRKENYIFQTRLLPPRPPIPPKSDPWCYYQRTYSFVWCSHKCRIIESEHRFDLSQWELVHGHFS